MNCVQKLFCFVLAESFYGIFHSVYGYTSAYSIFFFIMYLHVGKGFYFKSYLHPRSVIWLCGLALFLLAMATAFIGYVLPWGQMSFWGATVITNLFSVIPVYGHVVASWIWGGYAVDFSTLIRFFSFHYLLAVFCSRFRSFSFVLVASSPAKLQLI